MQILTCNENEIRINKFLAQSGVCSRRQADTLIENGKVKVNLKKKNNDVFAKVALGDTLSVGDQVQIDIVNDHYRYSISHHDYGIEIDTNNTKLKDNIDKSDKIEYEYTVKVRESCTPSIVNALLKGIEDRDSKHKDKVTHYKAAKRATITGENRNILSIVLIENRANIIKRLMNALHLTVDSVKRIRIANLNLNGLNMDKSRELTDTEVKVLMSCL